MGTTNFSFVDSGTAAMALQNEDLYALGITTQRRSDQYKDIPTFAEAGINGLHVASTTVLLAPRNISPEVFQTLKEATLNVLQSSFYNTKITALGVDVGKESGDQVYKTLREVKSGWESLIRSRSIKFGEGG